MKRILLFTMMCLFGLFSLNAQDDVKTINGDAVNESSVFPIPAYYSQCFTQTIYKASEIGHDAATITSIAFKKNSDDAVRKFAVYMLNTDKETLSSFEEFSDADRVYYNESLTTSSVDGWMTLELENSFDYDGGNIILITWDRTGSTSYKSGCMYSDKGSGNYCSWYSTNSTLNESNYLDYAYSQSTRQPALKLYFEPADDLEPAIPTNLTATALNHKSVSLTWDAAENAKKYKIYQNDVNIANTTETSYTVEGLTAETTYTFKVTGVRGAKESGFSNEASATTEVAPPDPLVGKSFRIKALTYIQKYESYSTYYYGPFDFTVDKYLYIANNDEAGVQVVDKQDSNAQKFTFEPTGVEGQYYLRSADGYYINCGSWNVSGYDESQKSPVEVVYVDDTQTNFYLTNGTGRHFKVETGYYDNVNFKPYCDAAQQYAATWVVEEVKFQATVTANNNIFDDQTATLSIATIDGSGNYTYSWSPAEGLSDVASANPTFTPATTGEYTFTCTVTDTESGATSEASVTVYVNARPALNLAVSADKELIYNDGETAVLTATVTENTGYAPYTYSWTLNETEVGTEATYTFSNTTVGEYTLTCTVTDARSNTQTVSQTIEVKDASERPLEIVLGTDNTGNSNSADGYIPSNTYYFYSLTQQIYTKNEIGMDDNIIINSIAFKESAGQTTTRTLSIYIQNTTETAVNSLYSMQDSDLCFTGSVEFRPYEWTVITLNTPFEYDATQNILLCVDDNTGNYIGGRTFATYYNEEGGSYYTYSDTKDFDPKNPSLGDGSASSGRKNHIKLGYELPGLEPTAPAAPQNLVATSTETTITLAWSPVEGATDYNVYYNISEEDKLLVSTDGDTTYTANDLEPNTFYCFNVTAVNATGESDSTELCSATKELQLLPAPQNLAATEVTETSITLTWDAVDGADFYVVYKDGEELNSSNGTTYTESGLTPGTEYCFEICAYDETSYTYGEKSTQVCATTEAIQLAENEIIIGTATTKYYSPFLTVLGGGSWFEAIYKSEEIGKACTISELAFSYKDGNETSADINIYLAETTKDEYASPDDATAESELTLVYSGTAVTLCDEEWETFVLNAPFNYSGENNLVVVVTTANTSSANNWNCYSGDANTVLIKGFGLDYKKPVLKFTLGEESETPVVVLPYRLQSITGVNENDNLYYVYSEDESRVEKITKGSYATLVEYNEDGTVAKTTYVFMWNGAPDYSSDYTVTDYTYTDGVLTSYTETKNYNWRDPETSEYALSYNEDGTVAEVTVDNRKYAYEYEDGKLVKETYSYYDQWAYPEPGYVSEYIKEFEYDENGNCVTETKYNAYQNPPVAQSGVDYFYDLNVEADSVYVFAYPHEVLPTHAYLVTKAVSYSYNEDWETKEVTKGDFSVKTYNYNEEVVNAPVAPINLVANVLNDTEVVLTWETLEEVESFKVYNGTELVSEGLVAKTDTVKGLEPLTEYTFTVVAVNGELESAASEEVKATTYNLVNVNPTEIAFGKVIVGDYWLREQKKVNVSIDRFGKEVKAVKTDNKFFRMTSPTVTDDPIEVTVNYNKNSEAGEYEGNLLVILASGDTVSFPLTATAYTPVTPDVFEHAQAIETVDGLFVDRPDFAALTDDYKLPGEDEDGNRPDAVYSFTLAEEASVEINVESDSWDGIYAVYNAAFEGNGPSSDNNVELTDRVYSTAFAYDFEDGSLEDFEIIDNDGDTEHTMKVEDGALVSWSYIYDYENWVTVVSYANECAVTKGAYNITEKSVLTFDARFKDGNGNGTYDQVTVQVTKDGETYTDIDWVVNEYDNTIWNYSAEFNTYRVDLGAKFAEKGLEYGEYRVALLYSSGSGSVAIDNIDLSERAMVYPAGDYYLVAAASGNFKVNVKSDALPELELDKEAHYRLVSREIDYAYERYNYASKIGTQVVNVNNSGDLDFLKYNDEGLLLGFVTCDMDENGGISDTLGVVEYIYEDSVLVGYIEKAEFMGQVQETEHAYHYNADGRIDTVRCEANNEVRGYTYNEEGLLVEIIGAYDYDGEFSYDYKQVYTYENGNLVKEEVLFYNWEAAAADTLHILPLDSLFSLSEETVYEYDSLGNVISAKIYGFYTDGDSLVKYLYEVADYVYDYNVSIENVFYFEYPHYAYAYMKSPVKPSHANIILAENRLYYDSYNNEYHTPRTFTYNYEEYTLEGEDTPVAPATPQNFVATATSDSEIVLTWNKVEGATGYNVYQGTETLVEGYADTTYVVTGLAAATTYTFDVAAVNGELVSNRATANATTLDAPTAPAAPVVTAEATSDTTIVLSWNKVEDALSYNVYNGTETLATALTDTTFVVKGLKANTEYTFGVTAVNAEGESVRGEAKAKTLEATPENPTDTIVPVTIAAPDTLLAEALSASSIKLTWTSVENAVSYNVYVNDSLKASATDTVYTVEGLEYNTEYVFAVTAVLNDTVESEKSPEVRVKTLGEGLAELSATVNIYPNPAVDRLVIETDSYVEEVSIYAITGTLVYKEVDFNSNAIDVSELRGGVYVMKVRTENGEVVKRFVKK